MEAPGGQDVGSVLDRTGDFSPCLLRLPATAAPRFRLLASERPPRTHRGVQ